MGKKLMLLLISLLTILPSRLPAQEPERLADYPFYTETDEPPYLVYEDESYRLEVIIQRDTIYTKDTIHVSHLNDVTRLFNLSFEEYTRRLLKEVEEADSTGQYSPERIYLNYLLPMYYPSYMERRYISRHYSVEMQDDCLKMNILNLRKPPGNYRDSVAMDVLLSFRGDVNTDHFLKSDYYRTSCLEQIFLSIHKNKLAPIKGINLYFPDFSFKEKRAMAQFIKSASLVIDSCNVRSMRDLRLYATFDQTRGSQHKNFLYGLTQMVDSVLLVNSPSEYWPQEATEILNKEGSEKISIGAKLVNQFYLARFSLQSFPESELEDELALPHLRQLIHADYPHNNWEIYLFVLIILVLILVTGWCFYLLNARFSYFINNNLTYIFSLFIMLILELYLLFICMVEAMSNEHVFTFGGEDKNTLLFFPLLLGFVMPMLNLVAKKREKP